VDGLTAREPVHRRGGGRARAAPDAVSRPLTLPAQVLALQRTAGNRAVVRLLQRDRKVPDDPHALADYAPVAGEVIVDTDVESMSPVSTYFKLGGRGAERDGLAVDVRLPDALAAPGAPAKAEKALNDGLANYGMALYDLHSASKGPARVGRTRVVELDLTPFGGRHRLYRFTNVARTLKRGKATAVDLLIEQLGAPSAPIEPTWTAIPKDRQLALGNRFTSFGFTRQQADADLKALQWTDDRFGMVLQALELIPDATLTAVRDIVWIRGMSARGATDEAGAYNFDTRGPTRRLTLFSDAFTDIGSLRRLIAHELGHAISMRPTEKKGVKSVAESAAYAAAVKKDGGLKRAITADGRKNLEEHFAESFALFTSDPDALKTLRPNVHAFFAQQAAPAPAPPKAAPAKPSGVGRMLARDGKYQAPPAEKPGTRVPKIHDEGKLELEDEFDGDRIELRTGAKYDFGGNVYKDGDTFAVSYKGQLTGDARLLQFIWREVVAHRPPKRGGKPRKDALEHKLEKGYDLTTNEKKPHWNTDNNDADSPFRERNTASNRSASELAVFDSPDARSDMAAKLFEKFADDPPTKVVSRAHFTTYVIRGPDILQAADIDLVWEFANATDPPKFQPPVVKRRTRKLDPAHRELLAKQFPKQPLDYLP